MVTQRASASRQASVRELGENKGKEVGCSWRDPQSGGGMGWDLGHLGFIPDLGGVVATAG